MSKFTALDTFMSAYLGPSSLYICGSTDIDKCIDYYIKTEGISIHQELIYEIDEYMTQFKNDEELTNNFEKRYRHSNYRLPAGEFLKEIQRKIN